MTADYPVHYFQTARQFGSWLAKNHDKEAGVWLTFYKKDSGIESLTYDEALDEALCYGWIDSQSKGIDEKKYLQKFTPRRSKGLWSKRNTEHIKRLIDTGKMKAPGLAQVEAAKADGRWAVAYDAPSEMKMPKDFLNELAKDKKALAFFQSLNKSNTYAIAWRLQTAKKPETRARRMKAILVKLSREEKLI